jgi:hypothetical protein
MIFIKLVGIGEEDIQNREPGLSLCRRENLLTTFENRNLNTES